MNESAVELAKSLYGNKSKDLISDLFAHLCTGYVRGDGGRAMIMFRAVRMEASAELISDPWYPFVLPNAWFIWILTSTSSLTIQEVFDFQPHPMPYIGWSRTKNGTSTLRFYESTTIYARRKCTLKNRIIPPFGSSILNSSSLAGEAGEAQANPIGNGRKKSTNEILSSRNER